MKPEEAIRHYKALHEDYKSTMVDYYKERFDEVGEEVVALLEKQIPWKPTLIGFNDCLSAIYECKCETTPRLLYKEHKFCPECGQKLDWGE